MTVNRRQYDSAKEVSLILNTIIGELSESQGAQIAATMEQDEDALQLKQELSSLPHPIDGANIPIQIRYRMIIGHLKAILATIPEIAMDSEKGDVLEVWIELLSFTDRKVNKGDDIDQFSELDKARFHLIQQRFREKPFAESYVSVEYTYDPAKIPAFLLDDFRKKVKETVIGALDENPDSNLARYEKEFNITVTGVKHPKRKTRPVSTDEIIL